MTQVAADMVDGTVLAVEVVSNLGVVEEVVGRNVVCIADDDFKDDLALAELVETVDTLVLVPFFFFEDVDE